MAMTAASAAKFTLALVLLAWSMVAGAATRDDDFLAAREAFRNGEARKLDRYAQRLHGYVLEPYVAYWQLRLKLNDATPEEVRAFIAAHPETLVAERLRAEWLKLLGRSQQWDLFDADFTSTPGDDVELTCYALQSKARSNPAEALQEARPLWFLSRELPDSCTPLFTALAASQQLSTEDVWTRVRLALEMGQVSMAMRVGNLLPAGHGPDLRVLSGASSNPGGFLEKQHFDLQTRGGREAVMFAVYRLARSSAAQAAAQWERLESRFDADERAYVWGQIAYFGAMRLDPSALEWYAKAGDLSDLQLAWKARAALRARSWKDVLAAIETMTSRERGQPAWRYWEARALKALGREEEALVLLKPLADEYNFYGQLATEELGEKIAVPASGYKSSGEDVRAMGERAGIQRALAFYRLNLRVDGNREWLWTIRQFDDRQLLAAAEVARRHELYDRAINTADRTAAVHDFSLRYIAPYRDVLQPHATRHGLDEAWVYGLIRQESRFISAARSSAGAGGLMQLMPATAKWVARKLGFKDWRWSHVSDVSTNINFGTYYLRHVLDTLDGQPVLASAAYNAGPGRARAWRPDVTVEGAVYAETIPFNETRDYVKKVMANATYYAHRFTHQLQSLKQRLGVIPPRYPERETALGDTP